MDKAGVNLDVGLQPVLRAEILDHLHCLTKAPSVAKQLHKDAQGVVAGLNARCLHLLQQTQCLADIALLGAAIQDRVVHDLVRQEVAVPPHLLENTQGALHITVQAIALDDRGVGDDVRLDVGFSHVFQKQRSLLHRIALRTGIQHGVVGDSVAGNIVISHFLVHSKHFVNPLGNCKALQHGRVYHGVDHAFAVIILQLVLDELPGLLSLLVNHQSLHHAADSDSRRLHIVALQLRPEFTDLMEVTGLAKGFDHGPVDRSRDVLKKALHLISANEVGEAVQPLDSDAGFDDRRKENFIDGLLHAVNQAQNPSQVCLSGMLRQGLQEDRAGDQVRLEAGLEHLVHNAPHTRAISSSDFRIQELVVGDLVGCQPARSHLLYETPCLTQAAGGQVALENRVVADNIHEAELLHLLKE
mmetsp:Transcript_72757/g.101126  ORF Transcript_72757/g.101126 Transcript_72757/m.101126 type:complete len:414 (+) Transcript_72757:595-1836(+)